MKAAALLAAAALVVAGALAAPRLLADDVPEGPVSEVGYIEMPEATDGSYRLASGTGSGRHWGRPEKIRFLMFVAREWRLRYPRAERLYIGDMSKPDASDFPPHRTHKDGLTSDLFTTPRNICHIDFPDQERTKELAELMIELGARQILYNHPHVFEALDEASEWPDHDGHFHVVIVPERVPERLAPTLSVPAEVRAGTPLGGAAFGPPPDQRPRRRPGAPQPEPTERGLRIPWRYLLAEDGWQRSYRLQVESIGDASVRYDSGEVRSPQTWHLAEADFACGQRLRWRVEVEGADGSTQASGWTEVRIDLTAPALTPLEPVDGAAAPRQPVLRWRYADASPQAWSRVEIRRSRVTRTITLDTVHGAETAFELPEPLPRGPMQWRVVAADAAGNEAASDWADMRIE